MSKNKSFTTTDELKQFLCDFGYEDAVVFEDPAYLGAVAGVSDDGRVIYDYEDMAQCLMKEDSMSYEEAIEFIDYNTIRALPYAGDMAPIILHPIEF